MRWPAHISFGVGTLALFLSAFSVIQPQYGYWGLSEWLLGTQNWLFVLLFLVFTLFIIAPYLSIIIDWFDHEGREWSDPVNRIARFFIKPFRFIWYLLEAKKPGTREFHDYAYFLIPLLIAYGLTILLPTIIPQWFFLAVAIVIVPTVAHLIADNVTTLGVKFFGFKLKGFVAFDNRIANWVFGVLGQITLLIAVVIFILDVLF
ncbi:MAG: hypothetical protein ACFFBD_17000 [Candidatus Hodarchaeota archaeon]